MILGLGTDIVEIERIAAAFSRHGKTFLDKIFTPQEQEYCLAKTNAAESLAARFCAKEAAAKAFGKGIGAEISFTDIEVINNEDGQPTLLVSDRLQKQFHNPQLRVSLSHCKSYATATVLWINNA
jgi:holo-[acyl-carrier protein] synthase